MTNIFTETFTGTDNAVWPTARWATSVWSSSLATMVISTNRGRIITTNVASQYIYDISNAASGTNSEMQFKLTKDANSRPYTIYAGINVTTIGTATAGQFDPANGAWIEVPGNNTAGINIKYKTTSGSVQTVALAGASAWNNNEARYWRMKIDNGTLYVRVWTVLGSEPGTWNNTISMGANTPVAGKPWFGIRNPFTGSSLGATTGVFVDDVVYDTFDSLDVNFTDTPATLSIAAPNPTLQVDRSNTYTATAATLSVAAPNATAAGGTGVITSLPYVTASVAVVNPQFRILQTWIKNLSNTHGQVDSDTPGTNDTTQIKGSSTRTTYIKFGTSVIPTDALIRDAQLTVVANSANNYSQYTLKPVTSDFDPATVTYGTKPTEGSTLYTSNLIGNSSSDTETYDITTLLQQIQAGTAYGLSFAGTNINTATATMSLQVTYWAVGDIAVPLDVVTLSVEAADATVLIDNSVQFDATPVTATVAVNDITVQTTAAVTFTDGPATISIEALNGFVGSPSVSVAPAPVELIVYTPNAEARGGTDVSVIATTANLTLEVNDVTFSNDTDVTVQASASLISVRMLGYWSAEDDRYYQALLNSMQPAVGPNNQDQWFRFEEFSGTTCPDNWSSDVSGDSAPATYVGSPTLRVEARDLRRAVGLDGVDDYIQLPGQGDPNVGNSGSLNGWSTEFVMRTSASNGVIYSDFNGSVMLELVNGNLQLVDYGTAFTYDPTKVNRFNMAATINDGQWHHIVVSAPNPDSSGRAFIMVDGKRVFARISNQVFRRTAIPYVVGRRRTNLLDTTRPGYLAADFDEFVVKGMRPLSENEAFAHYLEFIGATIVQAAPAELSVSTPNAFGRGNQKKMLLLWGLPSGRNLHGDELNLYQDVWGGVQFGNFPNLIEPSEPYPVGTFDYKGYKVYPVHIYDRTLSVQGVVEQESDWDNENDTYESTHLFVDNETGESRLIDLEEDLLIDVREFDVIHFVNWPDPDLVTVYDLYKTGAWPRNFVMNQFTYTQEVEKMRDGIRWAVDQGVGLWISEPRMAQEFGIIQTWDAHGDFMASGQFNPGERSEFRDVEIGPKRTDGAYDGIRNTDGLENGVYDTTHGIRKRRIVATATDFSEFETWYRDEFIAFHKNFREAPYADVYAQNVKFLEDGLAIGTEIDMDVWWLDFRSPEYGGPIVSARPEGIVGTVVAKEQAEYCKDGDNAPNPYADNATTILVERGEIVRGTPTGGRIFVELMDNSQSAPFVIKHADQFRNYLGGAPVALGAKPSQWDWDTRRNREVYSEVVWDVIANLTSGNNRAQRNVVGTVTQQQFQINDIPNSLEHLDYFGMNDRGLVWLSKRPWEDDDTNRIFATATKVTVTTPDATAVVQRNITFTAQPVLARVDVVKPPAYSEADVTVQAGFPAEITVNGGAYVKAVKADAAQITVETPNATTVAVGEDIVFYFDYPEYTFYLKEES